MNNQLFLEIVADLLCDLSDQWKGDDEESVFIPQCPFSCCSSCGCKEFDLQNNPPKNWAFFHDQDAHDFIRNPDAGLYLTWGGDGQLIATMLRRAGWCTVDWDGTESKRIHITPDKVLLT